MEWPSNSNISAISNLYIKNNLGFWSGDQKLAFDEKKPNVENLVQVYLYAISTWLHILSDIDPLTFFSVNKNKILKLYMFEKSILYTFIKSIMVYVYFEFTVP